MHFDVEEEIPEKEPNRSKVSFFFHSGAFYTQF
jgi:hypothetical protein